MNQRKKTAISVIIMMLLFLALASTTFKETVKANFCFPPSNPAINFQSPVNTTYSTNDIYLKIEIYTYKTGYYGAPDDESLRNFSYSLDGAGFLPFEITNSSVGMNPGTDVYFYGLIELHQLNEGYHNLTVKVVFDYSDLNSPYNTVGDTSEHYHYHTESVSNAYLAVTTSNKSQSSSTANNSVPELPWLLVVPLLLAVISVAVVLRHHLVKKV
jgi:hypothetical protein